MSSLALPLPALQGQVAAAGNNSNGQLGDGTTKQHRTPILVSALGATVTQVAAGTAFGVALKADGTVWTWGLNEQGQLGDGTLSNKLIPQQVHNLPAIKQISAGVGHVLALASDGAVWAWGANDRGQVGVEFSHAVPSPTKVSGLNGITQVSAGNEFSMTVGPNGIVNGWGDNHFRQLGSGEDFEAAFWLVTVRLANGVDLTNIIQVAAGADHTVALRGDGAVWIWGATLHLIESLPQQVLGLPSAILQVAAGGNDSFAVSADQTSVWAWGLNDQGRLGDKTTTARPAPVQIPLPHVQQIVAADGSTAAVIGTISGGTLWAWGEDGSGELGIDSIQPSVTKPTEALGLTNVTFVSMGHGFSLAIGIAHPRVTVRDRTDQAARFVVVSLSADGGAPPYKWNASNLPAGLSISPSSGVISGTPAHPSTYTVTVTATDRAAHAGSASFLWTITPQIVTVPNVLGLQKADAIAAMESVGLALGGISLDNGCKDVGGKVLLQYPPAGLFALVPGASFRLTVSSGHDSNGNPCTFK